MVYDIGVEVNQGTIVQISKHDITLSDLTPALPKTFFTYKTVGGFYMAGIGMFYFCARYYDPEIGGFTSTDPAEELWNSYSYTNANPINYIDPTGMEIDEYDDETGKMDSDKYEEMVTNKSGLEAIKNASLDEQNHKFEDVYDAWSYKETSNAFREEFLYRDPYEGFKGASGSGTTGQFLQAMYNTLEGSLLGYQGSGDYSSFSLLLNNKPQGPFNVGSYPINVMGRNVKFDVGIGLAAETKMNVLVNWKTMTVNATTEPGILFGVSKWGIPLPAAGTINSFSFSPTTGLNINYNSSLIGNGTINLLR